MKGIWVSVRGSVGRRVFFIALWLTISSVAVAADEEDFSLSYTDDAFVTIATGSRQAVARAPAVATVITAEDIAAIGATDLDEVLETVPGLHVARSVKAYNPLYIVRGVSTSFNPQVLVLINSIPITHLDSGDRGLVWGGMPVNNIARIEVIRGPGSAVYGADAFSGVINIITKTAADIDGTEVGARAGSYSTYDAWMLHGRRGEKLDMAFALELHTTDGPDEFITADAQTGFDAMFATNASLAPGPVNRRVDGLDTRLDLSRGNWRLRLGYQGRRDLGTGAGVAEALDPVGSNDTDRINADLTQHLERVAEHWDITTQLSYFDTGEESDLVLYPPGAFGGAFPDGVIGQPDKFERHTRIAVSAFYTGLERHRLRLGAGISYGDMYKVRESKNFDPALVPLGSVVDVSNDLSLAFMQPHDRRVHYAFAQDEWSVARDWELTAGVRWDHYSDFGSTVNPRLALVWQTHFDLTTKLLYGRAFRAPAFVELYGINNPVALGNPNLNPETIDTYELAFDYQYREDLRAKLNVFHYRMEDIIRFVPASTAQNVGRQVGYGLEWEIAWDVNPVLSVFANYAYQHSRDSATDADPGDAPRNQVYGRADWRFAPLWSLNGQLNYVAGRERMVTDTRPEIDDYLIVDLILRRSHPLGAWDWGVAVKNLADTDAREPSPAPGSIPNDLPLPGRSLFAEFKYRL